MTFEERFAKSDIPVGFKPIAQSGWNWALIELAAERERHEAEVKRLRREHDGELNEQLRLRGVERKTYEAEVNRWREFYLHVTDQLTSSELRAKQHELEAKQRRDDEHC
jgi:hypothetical protein